MLFRGLNGHDNGFNAPADEEIPHKNVTLNEILVAIKVDKIIIVVIRRNL